MPAENLEKYRKLYNLLNDSTKSPLFGDGQAFGRNCADRTLFKYFSDWIDELSRAKRLNPITVNSNTFIARLLSLRKEDDPKIAEFVNEIRLDHKKQVISDEPLNNTFYQFAEIIDELKVINDSEPGDVLSRYTDALDSASKLQPIGEKTAATAPTVSTAAKTENMKSAAESGKKEDAEKSDTKSESKAETETKTGSGSEIEAESASSSALNIQADSESSTEITETTAATPESTYDNSDKNQETPASRSTPARPRPLEQKPLQSSQPAEPVQPVSLAKSQSNEKSLSGTENQDAEIDSQNILPESLGNILTKKFVKRIVRRVMGKKGRHGLRKAVPIRNAEPQKLKNPNEQNQNRQNTQNSQEDQAETDSAQDQFYNNQPNRTQEEQYTQPQVENKNSIGKRATQVALGGSITAAGVISLFPEESATAATIVTHHTISLTKPIIAIIHLFL